MDSFFTNAIFLTSFLSDQTKFILIDHRSIPVFLYLCDAPGRFKIQKFKLMIRSLFLHMQLQPQSSGWPQYARKLCEKVSRVGGDLVLLVHTVCNSNFFTAGWSWFLKYSPQSSYPKAGIPFSGEEDAKIFVGKPKVDKEINLEK